MGKIIDLNDKKRPEKVEKNKNEKAKIIPFEKKAKTSNNENMSKTEFEQMQNFLFCVYDLLNGYDTQKFAKIYCLILSKDEEKFNEESVKQTLLLMDTFIEDMEELSDLDLIAAIHFAEWFWKTYENHTRIKCYAKKLIQSNENTLLSIGTLD